MPKGHKRAKSKAQLRAAYAHKGEAWADEIVASTHSTEGMPERTKEEKRGKIRRKSKYER